LKETDRSYFIGAQTMCNDVNSNNRRRSAPSIIQGAEATERRGWKDILYTSDLNYWSEEEKREREEREREEREREEREREEREREERERRERERRDQEEREERERNQYGESNHSENEGCEV
jgi:hypothetical protein